MYIEVYILFTRGVRRIFFLNCPPPFSPTPLPRIWSTTGSVKGPRGSQKYLRTQKRLTRVPRTFPVFFFRIYLNFNTYAGVYISFENHFFAPPPFSNYFAYFPVCAKNHLFLSFVPISFPFFSFFLLFLSLFFLFPSLFLFLLRPLIIFSPTPQKLTFLPPGANRKIYNPAFLERGKIMLAGQNV